jgi:hypothetical protein
MLIDGTGPAQHSRIQIIHGVHGLAATSQLEALHVPALGTSQCQNAILGEKVQGRWVNALEFGREV